MVVSLTHSLLTHSVVCLCVCVTCSWWLSALVLKCLLDFSNSIPYNLSLCTIHPSAHPLPVCAIRLSLCVCMCVCLFVSWLMFFHTDIQCSRTGQMVPIIFVRSIPLVHQTSHYVSYSSYSASFSKTASSLSLFLLQLFLVSIAILSALNCISTLTTWT